MSEAAKAIFLSYSRDDASAARRVAEALRSTGLEVWFDENELRGGDAWDAKIRRQIDACALFIAIISKNTESRAKGYFRLEWNLAVAQTQMLAEGVPFIAPVVIDDTKESGASVPAEFMRVQWMRLPGALPTPQFVEQIKRLLDAPKKAPANHRASDPATGKAPGRRGISLGVWTTAAVVIGASAIFVAQRSATKESATRRLPANAPATPSAVRQLIAKSAKLHDQLENATRSDLELAEQFCRQAVALDPNDGDAWAEYAVVSCNYLAMNYDRSDERRAAARAQAEKAVKLAPDSLEAQFALAYSYRWQSATVPEAERRLRELVSRMPGDKRVLRALANTLRLAGKSEEALIYYNRAAALPGGDPLALFQRAMALDSLDRQPEAEASLEESLALHPSGAGYVLKIFLLLGRGEAELARATLEKVPSAYLTEGRGALAASHVWSRLRQWDKCLEVLRSTPTDYFQETYYTGPKGLLSGDALEFAGRRAAAEADWRAALALVTQRLSTQGNRSILFQLKAELHARLGETAEAERALQTFRELAAPLTNRGSWAVAQINLRLNKTDEVIRFLQSKQLNQWEIVRLRENAQWDPLRGDPRLQALLKASEQKK